MEDAVRIHGRMDLRGWRCPWCILKTQSRLRDMEPGQVLEVVLSDPDAEWHFPRILENSEDRLIGMEYVDGCYRARILKGRSKQNVKKDPAGACGGPRGK